MRKKASLWFWHGVWVVSLLVGLGVFMLYAWLPADGATGDLASFTPEGFRVQWLLEERTGGLRVGDIIVRAGGHTIDEWQSGASRGPEWRTGGIVTYETLRDGQPMTLEIQLTPVPFRAILVRWTSQLLGALAFFSIGIFVFWKRPQELAARLFMLFCVTVSLQYWGDAYNFQYATLPWRWPLWFHLAYEHGIYSLSIATICCLALVFPVVHPLVERFPRLVPFVLYAFYPLVILGATALSPGWNAALEIGNRVSWVIAITQLGLAISVGIRSVRTARDPVTRAQIRWILWSVGIGVAVLIPGYALPLMLGGRPLVPHPVVMIFIAVMPLSLAIAILRYRLFDIEIIINRTLVYGTLTALLGGLYLLLVRLLTLLVQGVLHREKDTLVVFIATLSIALAFIPFRQRVQALIDRAFYRVKLDYQRLLPEMSERLATSIVPDQLAALLTEELPQRLQIAWATLAVLDPTGENLVLTGGGDGCPTVPVDHPLVEHLHRLGRPLLRLQPPPQLPAEAQAFLDQHSIELSIPLIVGTELVGLYNLGTKLSGDAYNRHEVRLLHLLGQQAAVAVENSRLYAEVKHSLEEKEVLLREIHHRVKNNLQVISSLFYLQSKNVKDKETLGILQESQSRVRSMVLVHERLYQSPDLARIDFAEYVRSLANYLFRSYGVNTNVIQLKLNVDDVLLGVDTAIPCGLILNELVSNALKHAFPPPLSSPPPAGGKEGGCEIRIELRADDDGQCTLVVSDNGVGFPEDLDSRDTGSLGLQLVNMLVEQLEGTIELDRSGGTAFKIAFGEPRHEEGG